MNRPANTVATGARNEADSPLIDVSPHEGGEVFIVVLLMASLAAAIGLSLANPNGVGHIVAAIFAGLSIVWLAFAWLGRRRRIRVFVDRIEQRTRFGTRTLRFDEVERIRLGPFRPAHAAMEAEVLRYAAQRGLRDERFELGVTAESEVCLYGPRVRIALALGYQGSSVVLFRQVAPFVLPRLCEELDRRIDQAGGVRFGKLTARPEGVDTPQGLVPWHEIATFTRGPAGTRLTAVNRPELTVTVPNQTDNLLVLISVAASRKARFWNEVQSKAADRGISQAQFIAAIVRHEPRGETFGLPEEDPEFGTHVCTLPPRRFLGIGSRRGKYALYDVGIIGGRHRIALADCDSVSYRIVYQYHDGAYIGTWRRLLLVSRNKVAIKLSSRQEEAGAFCDAVLGRVLPRLVADHTARIRAGETIHYGKSKLSQDTLTIRRKSIPVATIRRVSVEQGQIRVWTDLAARPVAQCDVAAPNGLVLFRLLHSTVEERQASRS